MMYNALSRKSQKKNIQQEIQQKILALVKAAYTTKHCSFGIVYTLGIHVFQLFNMMHDACLCQFADTVTVLRLDGQCFALLSMPCDFH